MSLPLSGRNILITRPKDQVAALADLLQKVGAEVVVMPLTRIEPPETWEELDSHLERLATYQWIIFASANAVSFFCQRLRTTGKFESLAPVQIAAIGPATARAVEKEGLTTAFKPPEFVAESLVKTFPGYPKLEGTRVLWPKTNIGRTLIADELQQAGAVVDIVNCYRTMAPENPEQTAKQLLSLLEQDKIDIITLTSSQTAKHLSDILHRIGEPKSLLASVLVAVIGPETARSAREHLGKVDIEASNYTIEGLVKSICDRAECLKRGSNEKRL